MTTDPGGSKPRQVFRKQRFYPHPVDVVWAALTEPEALAQWLMPNNIVPRRGEAFEFRIDPMGPISGLVKCRIIELEPPAAGRARMLWGWTQTGKGAIAPPGSGEMLIDWTLEAHEGGTRLTLTQTGLEALPWLYRKMMQFGWGTMLKRWLPVVCRQFQATPAGLKYQRLDKAPNRGHHKTKTVPEGFAK